MLSSEEAGYFDWTASLPRLEQRGGTVKSWTNAPVTVEAIDEILDANEYVVRGVPRTPTEVVDLLFGDDGPDGHRRFAPGRICDSTCECEDDGPLARVVIDAMRMGQVTLFTDEAMFRWASVIDQMRTRWTDTDLEAAVRSRTRSSTRQSSGSPARPSTTPRR